MYSRNGKQSGSSKDRESSVAEAVVEFDDVHFSFEDREVLRGLSFRVARRETKVLLGESGAGKTLAMKLAAGLLRPDAGAIRALGYDVSRLGEAELLPYRRKIGFVFQEGALFDSLSVADNVAFRLQEEGCEESEIEQRVRQALQFVEMQQAIDLMPAELSGGMRRRVAIARALVSEPELVFYDSPTAGLDPITSQTIITLLLRLRDLQGVTALLATQRLQDAFAMANYRFDARSGRVVPMGNGHGIAEAKPAALSEKEDASAGNHSAGDLATVGVTTLVFFRDGKVYFEGGPQSVLEARDPYLKEFLVSCDNQAVAPS
jgi:phospholipid/cholesterol/gamma-HCH transport system ATP-binding protein